MPIRLEISEKLDALASIASLGSTTPEALLDGLDAIRSLLLQSINESRRALILSTDQSSSE